ncbi:MAG: lipocalin family protein [Rhodobacteraceae bacterium]|nr:lipocalin family protein [Paracoccaceae bacterium]
MIRSAFVAALVAAAGSAGAEVYRDTAVAMQPVGQLDLDRYLGKWYEIARFPNSFETGCQGVTAEYALRGDGKVRVVNTCHTGAVDGPVKQARGLARVVAPGRLEVSFVPWLSFLPFLWGDYWILDVTPDYSVAVVGTPAGRTGWILARAPRIAPARFEAALQVLRDNGYDTGALIRVPQPGG